MSWLFSQALVGQYWGENFSDGEQSVLLSGKPIQQAYCAPDKMMDFSRLSQYGMTYKPLPADLGKELLTLYLEDFHAKTLAQQEKAQELTENDQECGEKWQGSFVKFDQNTHLWKTHQCSLLGDLDVFSETWPQWGLMRDGECWEQTTLEQTIRGTESGLSPNGVDTFHTPNTTGLDGGSNSRKALLKKQMWPTPIASRGGAWRSDGQVSMVARNVETYEEFWLLTQGTSKKKREKFWPTPATRDYKGAVKVGKRISKSGKIQNYGEQLPNAVGGKLNPTWVEWLMGWPLGWTDLKPLEMDKSHFVQQQLGES
jgi:hypothetical protein